MGGKQGRGQVFINSENPTAVAGKSINCIVHLLLNDKIKKPVLEITFSGKESATFQGDGIKKGKNLIISYTQSLIDKSLTVLEAGSYSFPFILEIPQNIPGTFKASMKNLNANIDYTLKVELKENREFICNNKTTITVEQVLNSNRQSILKTQETALVCCDCFNKGTCSVVAHLDKYAYLPGELAHFWIDVDNSKSMKDLTSIFLTVWRVIRLISNNKETGVFKKSVFSTAVQARIPARRQALNSQEISVDIPILADDPATEQCATTIGKIVQCRYYISITTDFGNCMSRVVEFEIPIIIAPRAVQAVLPSAPEDWNPIEMPKASIVIDDFKNISAIDRSSLDLT